MTKVKSLDEIRQELIDELHGIAEIRFISSEYQDQFVMGKSVASYTDKLVERALKKFDESLEDKKRQLDLGELADKFFQRIKIND